ncbi:MAG TPA: hypothetical protein VK141_02920, partial [Nitrosomonas sp.]|nr:hypothetical protein [Nitrosomonas sp.]
TNDFIGAKSEIIITSPFVSKQRINRLLPQIQAVIGRKVSVSVITRPVDDFKDADKQKVSEIYQLLAKSVFIRHPNPESIRQVIPELSGTPIRNQTGRFC